jgi:hypothetical protein
MRQAGSWHPAVPVAVLGAGGVLGVTTTIVAALNAVCAPLALAMATSSVSAITAGLVGGIVPTARTGWQRGFRQGLEAGTTTPPDPEAKGSSPRRPP